MSGNGFARQENERAAGHTSSSYVTASEPTDEPRGITGTSRQIFRASLSYRAGAGDAHVRSKRWSFDRPRGRGTRGFTGGLNG